MAANRRARTSLMLGQPEYAVEKVYRIAGTDMSLSSDQTEFDYKAADKILEINRMDLDAVVVCDDPFKMVPEETHGDQVFLSNDAAARFWADNLAPRRRRGTAVPDRWSMKGSYFGHGIPSGMGQYMAFKQTYVYYKDNQKTHWIMDIYDGIHGNTIQLGSISLCHVFQSDGNYDPRPRPIPTFSAFDQRKLHSYAEELEALIYNPKAFMDFDECDKSGGYSTTIANDRNEKRSQVWQHFTEIKVLGSNGVKVLTLAICHTCNVAYNTGGLKRKSKDSTELVFKCNGTKTMWKHKERCGQPHIDGNSQGAPH